MIRKAKTWRVIAHYRAREAGDLVVETYGPFYKAKVAKDFAFNWNDSYDGFAVVDLNQPATGDLDAPQ